MQKRVLIQGVLIPFHLELNQNNREARAQAGLGHLALSRVNGATFDLCKWLWPGNSLPPPPDLGHVSISSPLWELCAGLAESWEGEGGGWQGLSLLHSSRLRAAGLGCSDLNFLFGLRIQHLSLAQEGLRLYLSQNGLSLGYWRLKPEGTISPKAGQTFP